MNEYKSKVEELPPAVQNKFPAFGYFVKTSVAITRNNIYFYIVRTDKNIQLEILSNDQFSDLEKVMDDNLGPGLTEERNLSKEVADIIEISLPIYQFIRPNNFSLMDKNMAEYLGKEMYKHFYQWVAKNSAPSKKRVV